MVSTFVDEDVLWSSQSIKQEPVAEWSCHPVRQTKGERHREAGVALMPVIMFRVNMRGPNQNAVNIAKILVFQHPA